MLTDEEIAEFATAIQAAALSGKPSASLTALVFAVPWAGAAPHYIDRLVADAASGTFATANTAITTMQALTQIGASHIKERPAGAVPANSMSPVSVEIWLSRRLELVLIKCQAR